MKMQDVRIQSPNQEFSSGNMLGLGATGKRNVSRLFSSHRSILLKCVRVWWLLVWSATLAAVASEAAVPRLKVSANHHFLVFDDGTPFFWQADTAWELSMHLNRADMEKYLTRRHEQGFTVAYVVAFGVVDG